MTTEHTRLWGGRFTGVSSPDLQRFSRSDPRYFSLAPYDVEGSRAHVRELRRAGLITEAELEEFMTALDGIARDYLAGELAPSPADEDVHTFLERVLIERMGPAGGKIRAGRSRNDQAANDLRLYLRDAARSACRHVIGLATALADQAEAHLETPAPGFTHLQPAQPIVFGHQLLAHAQPLLRDLRRFQDWDDRAAVSPLGAAALAGSSFALHPELSAAELGYRTSADNSIDAVASRDIAIEFLFVSAMTFLDISRLCEEITLWASPQFGWISLDDAYCTGSSIMPQKKNPDIAELARGRSGRLLGDLMGLMSTVKALPLAYNRDLIGDKHAVLDAVEAFELALPALTGLVGTFAVDAGALARQATQGFTLATEVADALARRGLPFNEAHEVAGALVRFCEEHGLGLEDLTTEHLRHLGHAGERLTPDVMAVLDVGAALHARAARGGTAPARVREQLDRLRQDLAASTAWIDDYAGPRFA